MRKNPLILSAIISLIFYGVFFTALKIIASSTETNTWNDFFTLGQFLVEICLVPVAITGFIVTITELRKAQQIASLELFWKIGENKYSHTLTIDRPATKNYVSNPIVLLNKGNAPSIHYQITLEYPLLYGRARMENDEWKHATHQIHKHIFNSAAQFIAFPDNQVELGIMNFLEGEKLPDTIMFHYYISSDRSEYKEGNLIVNFRKAV